MNQYYVYIMSNKSGTLYTGITNDLVRRVFEHRTGIAGGFTRRYKVTELMYFETTDDVAAAISREKEIKGKLRCKKVELIKTLNPEMKNLSEGWFEDPAHP